MGQVAGISPGWCLGKGKGKRQTDVRSGSQISAQLVALWVRTIAVVVRCSGMLEIYISCGYEVGVAMVLYKQPSVRGTVTALNAWYLVHCRSCVEATLLRSVDTSDSSAVSRQCYSIVQEQRHSASPCFFLLLLFTHSEAMEIHGLVPKSIEV